MPQYLTEHEVAELINRKVQTLRNDRFKGQGLPYIKMGRMVRYNYEEVVAFMDSHKIQPEAS